MRIAYTCHDAFPSASTNTQQTFWTLVEVARLGISVDLIVPAIVRDSEHADGHDAGAGAGDDPRGMVARYYGLPGEALPERLGIIALGDRPLRGPLEIGRFDWHVGRHVNGPAAQSSAPKLDGGPYDLVWTRDPLALLSSVRAQLPTIFETYRPDFATRRRFAPWRRMCLTSPYLRGVVTHSRLAADAFVAAGVAAAHVLVAHNGFAPSILDPVLTQREARTRLGLPLEGPIAVYAGHVGPAKGVDVLVSLAAAVPQASIVIVGTSPDSPDGQRLREAARRAGARNVLLRPRVPLAEVPAYLYAADCLLIPPTGEPLHRFRRTVLPMKLFMCLAAGRPILAPRLPDIQEVLTDGENARLVSPDDVREAGSALASLLADQALRERLSRGARVAAAQYTWAARARRIAEFMGWLDQAGKHGTAGDPRR